MTLEQAIIYFSQRRQRIVDDRDDLPIHRVYEHHGARLDEIDCVLSVLRDVTP
jgi:hypothetical protein